MSNLKPSQIENNELSSTKELGTSTEEKIELLIKGMGEASNALNNLIEASESTCGPLELHVKEIAELKQQIEVLKRTK